MHRISGTANLRHHSSQARGHVQARGARRGTRYSEKAPTSEEQSTPQTNPSATTLKHRQPVHITDPPRPRTSSREHAPCKGNATRARVPGGAARSRQRGHHPAVVLEESALSCCHTPSIAMPRRLENAPKLVLASLAALPIVLSKATAGTPRRTWVSTPRWEKKRTASRLSRGRIGSRLGDGALLYGGSVGCGLCVL